MVRGVEEKNEGGGGGGGGDLPRKPWQEKLLAKDVEEGFRGKALAAYP